MSWLQSPEQKYGASLLTPSKPTTDATATASVQPVPTPKMGGALHPSDPMFWFGVIAAGTFALMAYSTGDIG